MNIFKVITGNIVKWWQLSIMPILRIDNNKPKRHSQDTQKVSEDDGQQTNRGMTGEEINNENSSVNNMENNATDAQAVMDRINREQEEKRKRDLEKARLKAEEDARLASILNATKVDVSAFIQEGRKAMEEKEREEKEVEKSSLDDSSKNVDADALARAQEIMDRLNREAAEDEAKKQAEIEAAKQKAKETFGV